MRYKLDYYSTYGPCGKIYIRCKHNNHHDNPCQPPHPIPDCPPPPHACEPQYPDNCEPNRPTPCKSPYYSVIYTLYRGHEEMESKKAEADELVGFSYSCSADYVIKAMVYNEKGYEATLRTYIIKPGLCYNLPQKNHAPTSLKGHLCLIDKKSNRLQVQFYKGGLEKLENEEACKVPIYYKIRSLIQFVRGFSDKTIEKVTKYSPEFENYRYQYYVEATLPDEELLAFGRELETLDYVEFCAIQGKVAGVIPEGEPPSPCGCGPLPPDPCGCNSPPSPPCGYAPQPPASWEGCQQPPVAWGYNPQPPAPSGHCSQPNAGAFEATPDLTGYQGHLNNDSAKGTYVRAVWDRGITSSPDIKIYIMDNGVYRNHEDLANVTIVTNDEYYMGNNWPGSDHGTGSSGVLVASNNGFGVIGLAFNTPCYSYGRSWPDLDLIVARAEPGDVFSVSLGSPGTAASLSLPTIHNATWFTKLRTLVNKGVLVVVAAGNGDTSDGTYRGVNLRVDSRFTNHGQSGAILAAGWNPTSQRREAWSNYNWDMLLNTWGDDIPTTGVERRSLFNGGTPQRRYGMFWGTSGATPLIGGVMALLQSYAKSKYAKVFNNYEMYDIITATGILINASDLIGNRPNVLAAVNYIDQLLEGTEPSPGPDPDPDPEYPLWQIGVYYYVGDRVSHLERNYRCTTDHLSIPTWAPGLPGLGSLWVLLNN